MFKNFPKSLLRKVVQPQDIESKVKKIRFENTIVSLNGSFDLLHAGHLEIFTQAKAQGDILIVALNSDESIKKYKNALRPIIPLSYRLQMVSALEMVDFVTWFEETTPLKILSLIKPDIHVNGSEYGKDCIEAPTVQSFGGRVHVVKLVDGLSTSNIIDKIKDVCV